MKNGLYYVCVNVSPGYETATNPGGVPPPPPERSGIFYYMCSCIYTYIHVVGY